MGRNERRAWYALCGLILLVLAGIVATIVIVSCAVTKVSRAKVVNVSWSCRTSLYEKRSGTRLQMIGKTPIIQHYWYDAEVLYDTAEGEGHGYSCKRLTPGDGQWESFHPSYYVVVDVNRERKVYETASEEEIRNLEVGRDIHVGLGVSGNVMDIRP